MVDRRHIVLVVGVLAGVGMLLSLAVRRPHWVGVDYLVYERAALAAVRGGAFYDVPPPGFEYTYVYPPASVLAFVPLAALPGWVAGFAAFTLTELLAAAAVAWTAVALAASAGVTLDRRDRLLVGAFCALSAAATTNLFYAQVNHHLAAALGAGLLAMERERGRLAGVALAVPAYLKVFPAAVGVWLLRRRDWWAVAAAVVTGLGLYAVGILAFGPGALTTYVEDALLARLAADTYEGAMPATALYVTLRRPVSVLAPGLGTVGTSAVVAGVLAVPLVALYRDLSTPRARLLGAHGTVVAVLLFFPSYPTYLLLAYPTLLAGLYVLDGRPRTLWLAGTLLVGFPVTVWVLRAGLAGAPPVVAGPVLAVGEPILTLGTPPLYGLLLTLAAAVLDCRRG
jgi:hypothetical protein